MLECARYGFCFVFQQLLEFARCVTFWIEESVVVPLYMMISASLTTPALFAGVMKSFLGTFSQDDEVQLLTLLWEQRPTSPQDAFLCRR